MDKYSEIRARIEKILAFVKANGNAHERANAMLRLQELLVKHRLELTDFESKQQTSAVTHVMARGHNGNWAVNVAGAIAKLNFCRHQRIRILTADGQTDFRWAKHVFIGQQHEAEVACELAILIMEQLAKQARSEGRLSGDGSYERAFLKGAMDTIIIRCAKLSRAATQPSPDMSDVDRTNALVVASHYEQAQYANDLYFNEKFVFAPSVQPAAVRPNRQRPIPNPAATAAGREFGHKIPLHITKKLSEA